MKKKRNRKDGFTLLELLTVMAIMLLIMGATVAAFFGIGQGGRRRGAVSNLVSTLSVARQSAITQRTRAQVIFSATDNSWVTHLLKPGTTNIMEQIRTPHYLPMGISFQELDLTEEDRITFRPDGGLGVAKNAVIKIHEPKGESPIIDVVTVHGLTGVAKVTHEGGS